MRTVCAGHIILTTQCVEHHGKDNMLAVSRLNKRVALLSASHSSSSITLWTQSIEQLRGGGGRHAEPFVLLRRVYMRPQEKHRGYETRFS